MIKPRYDLEKIKFVTEETTFKKAIGLYENGKVTKFKDTSYTYTAIVLGTQPYRVFVSNKHYDQGNCECYLGRNDSLCKHMVTVAIFAVARGRKLTKEEKTKTTGPVASGILGELKPDEMLQVKEDLPKAFSYIKYYRGPSKIWFAYQNSLDEGVNRLSATISKLPTSEQTGNLIIRLLLRLDKKLQSGVDDSDGTVGGFIEETVEVLKEYVRLDRDVIKSFKKLVGVHTCFGWEEALLKMV